MDIQKQKNLYLAKLLEQEVIKQDEFDDLVFKPEINAFHSNYLSSRFMDNINFGWSAWQAAKVESHKQAALYQFEINHLAQANQQWREKAAKAQAVPEGFVLLPIKDAKFFSHDGDNYEVHDTLVEAKYEAECAIEHYRERLADQLSDPRSDGNFQDVGYGVVLAKSGYSIDHVVTQADIDKGDYSYEVGTEILSLFLIEAQEPAND